jgi:alkylation response protein AidB-like acyl-CoA dehydrogenase
MTSTTSKAGNEVSAVTAGQIESELREALGALLREHCGTEAVAAVADGPDEWDRGLWNHLAVMGVPGLAVPAESGGEGAGYALAVVAQEELGRRLAPVPTVSLLAVQAALAAAGGPAAERWLPRTSSGDMTAALVTGRGTDGWSASGVLAEDAGDGNWTVHGEVPVVAEAAGADLLLVAAGGPHGPVLLAVETGNGGTGDGRDGDGRDGDGRDGDGRDGDGRDGKGESGGPVRISQVDSLDPTRPLAAVSFDHVPAQLIADAGRFAEVLEAAERAALLALAADAVGVAAEALDLAVEHARTRQQFGRLIGSFQAISHRCADMLIAVESARALVTAAAAALDESGPDSGTAVRLAAAEALDAGVAVAQGNLQVHGGMGFTWEHPAHRYLRRAKAAQALIALPDRLRDRVAGDLLSAAGPPD